MLEGGVDKSTRLAHALVGRLAVQHVLHVLQVEHADDVHPGASGGVAVTADALGLAARLHLRLNDGLDAVHRHACGSRSLAETNQGPIQTNFERELSRRTRVSLSLSKHNINLAPY